MPVVTVVTVAIPNVFFKLVAMGTFLELFLADMGMILQKCIV